MKLVAGLLLFGTAILGSPTCFAAEGETTAHVIRVGEHDRTYYLHLPRPLPADKVLPLVLAFHGGGGKPAFIERESKFSELADREGFLVAYPEGIDKSWNDGRDDPKISAQRKKIDDVAFIAALLDEVAENYRLDTKRVFATGISNGGMMSHYLGTNLSSRIAAIAPVATGFPEPVRAQFKPEQPVSVLMLSGTADPLVPYAGGDVTVFGSKRGRVLATDETVKLWVEHNGCKPDPVKTDLADADPNDGCRVTTLTYTGGRNGSEVVLYRIDGGGHTWPDGVQYLGKRLIGEVCRDFNGTETIWEFFKTHPKP